MGAYLVHKLHKFVCKQLHSLLKICALTWEWTLLWDTTVDTCIQVLSDNVVEVAALHQGALAVIARKNSITTLNHIMQKAYAFTRTEKHPSNVICYLWFKV